ncbi:hypothetical protein [Pedococcus sp. 5OH_020]|uniref:hypothetical protein n=1 Tax=Pedococcus sp. 5OH_020 TaxID=2989814 RepID=UPI0022E9E608|nr:hypothetical protein [Pedococcus sp. 5OH_020]
MTAADPILDPADAAGPTEQVDPPAPSAPPRRQPARWVSLSVGAVLVVGLATRGWVAWRGYYYLDDFTFMAKAAGHSALDPDYLLEPYNSHLMPGAYLWVWVLTWTMPFHYGAVVVVTVALQAVLGGLFYTLLRRLFGASPLVLLPFAVLVLSPLTLPGTTWWAAAVNQVPQQLAMVAALLAHTAYLRTGRVRQGLLGPLALVGGLLFSEKTLLLLPLVAGLTVLFFTTGPARGRIRVALSRHRVVWLGYAVVALPYLGYYVTHVPSPARHPGQGSALVQLGLESLVRGVVPALLGGPWTWVRIGYAGALADPSPFACGVALVLAVAVVVGSCLLHRDAWRGWVLATGYGMLNLVVLAFSRAAIIGPVIGDEYRYVTDLALVAALGLGLATVPLAGRWRLGPATTLAPRETVRRWFASSPVRDQLAELPRPTTGGVAAVATSGLVLSATWSTVAYDEFWHDNPARPWVRTASAELARADGDVVLAEGYVPQKVAWALLGPYAGVGRLLSPLPEAPRTLASGPAADALWMLDSEGRLQRAAVEGISARKGPAKSCGWRLGARAVTIPLQKRTLPFRWTLRIGYLSTTSTTAVVTVGGHRTTVPFHAGLGSVYLLVDGAVDQVTVSALQDAGTLCTDDVTVGTAVPAAGGSR